MITIPRSASRLVDRIDHGELAMSKGERCPGDREKRGGKPMALRRVHGNVANPTGLVRAHCTRCGTTSKVCRQLLLGRRLVKCENCGGIVVETSAPHLRLDWMARCRKVKGK